GASGWGRGRGPTNVRMVRTAVAEPLGGTFSRDDDHVTAAPGILDESGRSGTTSPPKPPTLVNVTLSRASSPARIVAWAGSTPMLKSPWAVVMVAAAGSTAIVKSPLPEYEIVVEAPVASSG